MKTEIVVARYNENLDWLKLLSEKVKITIYNKGNNDIDFPFIALPNIGRESHTYLYHIITNYNNLADRTIFCQGDSIFHSPDFIKLIKHRKYFEHIQPLAAYYSNYDKDCNEGIPPPIMLTQTKNLWIKNKYRVYVEYINNNYQTKYPYFYYNRGIELFLRSTQKFFNFNHNNFLDFECKLLNLKNNITQGELIPFCIAGLFSVEKFIILTHSVDFYKNILNIIIRDSKRNYDHGYHLERLWLVIFNYKKYNKNFIKLQDYVMYNKKVIPKDNKVIFKINL